ncbi:MAG: septum formation initiator family protein [Oliverpabstia sp.]|nr:septum formation initiator family protein [Oliverpabstia sp.]
MASNGRRRVNSRTERYEQYIYDGSAVRKLQPEPEEVPQKKKVSHTVSRNRVKAKRMSRGYVVFLAAISVVALLMCVKYLQLRSQITTQLKEIAAAESELSQLKADNDALYNSVVASVDLEYIKNVAMNRLGMKYPDEDQLYQFNTAGNSYVRQYQNIPDVK